MDHRLDGSGARISNDAVVGKNGHTVAPRRTSTVPLFVCARMNARISLVLRPGLHVSRHHAVLQQSSSSTIYLFPILIAERFAARNDG